MGYVAAVAPPDTPKSPPLSTVLGLAMALNTLIGMYAAGVLGIGVAIWFGPGFAEYLWMARADTPVEPHLPYPWLASIFFGLLPIPLIRARHWQLAGVAAVPFALVPWVQLYLLYLAATPQMFE